MKVIKAMTCTFYPSILHYNMVGLMLSMKSEYVKLSPLVNLD
jgi:hypothetical protein